jgi:hypothetical protein
MPPHQADTQSAGHHLGVAPPLSRANGPQDIRATESPWGGSGAPLTGGLRSTAGFAAAARGKNLDFAGHQGAGISKSRQIFRARHSVTSRCRGTGEAFRVVTFM